MSAGHDLWATLVALFARVSTLSLISFGGVNTILPALHYQAVNEQHWMTDRDFVSLFALASVSPGPNFMVVTLIGYKAAGVLGALVATFALLAPTSLLVFAVVKVWDRFETAHWRIAIQNGLLPVTVGFVGAGAVLLVHAADNTIAGYLITAAVVVVGTVTRWNPLWVFAASAVVGAFGLV